MLVCIALIGLFISLTIYIIYSYVKMTNGICKYSGHLVGKVVIVTGANAGIGYESAKDFAARGARVILACRSEQRGTAARDKIINATGNNDVHFKKLDLASFASIRTFADDINKNEKRLDILVNNAGIVMGAKKELTEDGLLVGMQTNHFGPFLLTHLLLDKLKECAPSRIINVSSQGHTMGKIEFDNLNMEKKSLKVKQFGVYANSKLCNILMTKELANRLKGTGVTTNSLCPGPVDTEIINEVKEWWFRASLPILYCVMKTAWEGAQTTIYLAVSPEVKDISGEYFRDCAVSKCSKAATDMNVARKLWEVSEKLCKIVE